MSPQTFSERLTQALKDLSYHLDSSDIEPESSKPFSGQINQNSQFSDRLQNLLSLLTDSSDSNGPPLSSTGFHQPKPQPESSKGSSKEEPLNSDTPESSPEGTEEEFVPEAPEITYQFTSSNEDQDLASLDLAGVQLFLIIIWSLFPNKKVYCLQIQYIGCQWMKRFHTLSQGAGWETIALIDTCFSTSTKLKTRVPCYTSIPTTPSFALTTICHLERIADPFKGLYSYLKVVWCP